MGLNMMNFCDEIHASEFKVFQKKEPIIQTVSLKKNQEVSIRALIKI